MSRLRELGHVCLLASLALSLHCTPGGGEAGVETAPTARVEGRHRNLPLNNPSYVAGSEAGFMRPADYVVGVAHRGVKRAYPWLVLANHHIANDSLAGDPVFVASCEVCAASVAFLALSDGVTGGDEPAPLSFSIRGMDRGTWVGEDRETGSRWYPFVGRAFAGPLAGERLTRLRTYTTTWEAWYRAHPDTQVVFLSPEMRRRPHGLGHVPGDRSVYPGSSDTDFERLLEQNPKLRWRNPAELVFGLFAPSADPPSASAWPLSELQEPGPRALQIDLGGEALLLVVPAESPEDLALAAYRRVLNQRTLEFSVHGKAPLTLEDQDGDLWNAWGECIEGGKQDMQLEPADGYLTKWYEWVENFPHTELRGENLELTVEAALELARAKSKYVP